MSIKKYDVAIIGGGISGLLVAFRLIKQLPNIKIVIIEKGKQIEKRSCPIIEKKSNECLNCKPCAIMNGIAGAGAFSDGKYIITNEYGGWLSELIHPDKSLEYMEIADKILVSFGATEFRYKPDDELKRICLQNKLNMKQGEVKHLGTENNYHIMMSLVNSIKENCEVLSESEVTNVNKDKHIIEILGANLIEAENIIFAVGRSGSSFLIDWCLRNNIELSNNNVDVGVRIELPSVIWKHISDKVYDPKISYRSQKYGDNTRMFCFNDGGSVVMENSNGVITVNGHAYADENLKTENSNFALLSTIEFSEPFHKPIEYLKHIAGTANFISDGSVIVQRFGDLINGRRTNKKRLADSTVKPTLNAAPGDLSLCIPKRQLDNIIETIQQLDRIAPGTANYDTLLYGVECKYYSARPKMNNFELQHCSKIYACGDGAGITRSLAQAAANGLYVADIIFKQYGK
jgi:uncharacterized FAD-dependent dehydrogenase